MPTALYRATLEDAVAHAADAAARTAFDAPQFDLVPGNPTTTETIGAPGSRNGEVETIGDVAGGALITIDLGGGESATILVANQTAASLADDILFG